MIIYLAKRCSFVYTREKPETSWKSNIQELKYVNIEHNVTEE